MRCAIDATLQQSPLTSPSAGEQGRLPHEHSSNADGEMVFAEWELTLAWVALARQRWEKRSAAAVSDFLELEFFPACQRLMPFRLRMVET